MSCDNCSNTNDTFVITQSGMDWYNVQSRESIFSLTNGLLGTRASFEEPFDGTKSMPMTFMAGLYNTVPDGLPELPVLPDWLTTDIMLDGDTFDMRLGKVMAFNRTLDMSNATLTRCISWESLNGNVTELRFTRFLSLAQRELAVVRIEIKPINWSGPVELTSKLTAPITIAGQKHSHWEQSTLNASAKGLATYVSRTRQTERAVSVAMTVDADVDCTLAATTTTETVGVSQSFDAQQGKSYSLDRFVAFVAADPNKPAPTAQAVALSNEAKQAGFDGTLTAHQQRMTEIWSRIDIEIDGPAEDQRGIRYNLFQLATLCPAPGDFASIGPKGLTGTAYLGHIFWDTEIYMIPFFAMVDPPGAKTLLEYRYKTLDGARRKARNNGYGGAQFAWESADTGDETCPKWLPDPNTGNPVRIWTGDLQDHVTADVVYAIDQYVTLTGDKDFLWNCGAEIFFETARFWIDRVTDTGTGTSDPEYSILDSMGPDEFHLHVRNDAFVNYLAHWNLAAAIALYKNDAFPKAQRDAVIAKINLQADEPAQWQHVADHLVLPYDEATGLIEQHEGFFARPDVSPDLLTMKRHGAITDIMGPRLAIEGQVLKQAEVVALQVMLEERFDEKSRNANFDYYAPRTSHDSSLSVSAHAWAAARLNRNEEAYRYLQQTLQMDMGDECGNVAAGLHTANMGGVWIAIAQGIAGVRVEDNKLTATPVLPSAWQRVSFKVHFNNTPYRIECTKDGATITEA